MKKARRLKGKPDKPPGQGGPSGPSGPVEPVEPPPPGDPVSGKFKGTVDIDAGEQGKAVEGTFSGTCDPDTGEFDVMGVLIAGVAGPVPVNSVAPTVSPSSATVGAVLSCTTGSWTNTPTSYAYQWMIGGADIGGATSSTYTTAAAGTLTCKVRASNANGPAVGYTTSSNSSAVSAGGGGTTATSVSQFGITLQLGQSLNVIQDVLGDWMVEMPVSNTLTLASVSPAWNGNYNGAMLDPIAVSGPKTVSCVQGYSNRDAGTYTVFSDSVRFKVGTDAITVTTTPKSLILTSGRDVQLGGGGAQILKKAICVTFFPNGTLPSANAFRPPYCAGPKPVWYYSELNLGVLPARPLPPGETNVPNQQFHWNAEGRTECAINLYSPACEIEKQEAPFDGVQIGQYLCLAHNHQLIAGGILLPEEQTKPYGSERGRDWAALIMACMTRAADNPNLATHVKRLFSLGRDLGACHQNNGLSFAAGAGFGVGYKAPIMIAYQLAPNDARRAILVAKEVASDTLYTITQTNLRAFEDGHTYYWPNGEAGWGLDGVGRKGTTAWGTGFANHDDRPSPTPLNLFPEQDPAGGGSYRTTASRAYGGGMIALADMGLRSLWAYEAHWDYVFKTWFNDPRDPDMTPTANTDGYGYGCRSIFTTPTDETGQTGGPPYYNSQETFNRTYYNAYVKVTAAGTPVTSGTNGVAISNWTITASGGTGPYTYSATGLPTGMSVNSSSGVVGGTPTGAGSYTVKVRATDTKLTWDHRAYTLVIA